MFYHRFAYSTPVRPGEEPKPSRIRDGAAFGELVAPLGRLNYEYGHIIFNPPFDAAKDVKLGHEHFAFVEPEDLLVLTTRPPLDDSRHGDKKHVQESGSHLEEQLFAECRKYLEVCARSHVRLTAAVAKDFERADLVFHQHKGARLKSYARLGAFRNILVPKDVNVTIGFFLRTKSIPVYGCGLLACFGMGGWETLIMNRIVRTRFPDWLDRPSFVVAELSIASVPSKLVTLEFVDQIAVKILLEQVE